MNDNWVLLSGLAAIVLLYIASLAFQAWAIHQLPDDTATAGDVIQQDGDDA